MFRIFQEFLTHFLDQLSNFLHVLFKVDPQFELHDYPVTTEIGQGADRAVRDGVDRSIMMS